jgi:hypothetical protein
MSSPDTGVTFVLDLSTAEAQGLALLCSGLTVEALGPLAWELDDGVIVIARWAIIIQRLADQLTFAGFPPVHIGRPA